MYTTHGGDREGFALTNGTDPKDFSANISPLGMPDFIEQAAVRSLKNADGYPDPLCRRLTEAIARKEGVSDSRVLCGGGAADLIWRTVGALSRLKRCAEPVLLTAPTFGEYEAALAAFGLAAEFYELREENDFAVEADILERIPRNSALFLCEPNNPTGVLTPLSLRISILKSCRKKGTLLVCDESFLDFLPSEADESLISELNGGGLLIYRSFAKMYAMAGLRVGYALCGDAGFLREMGRSGPPWNVSVPAQAAALAALNNAGYSDTVRELINTERPRFAQLLRSAGLTVWEGKANYLLIKSERPSLWNELAKEGFLLRSCDNYRGLGPQYLRVCVKTPAENEELILAVCKILKSERG